MAKSATRRDQDVERTRQLILEAATDVFVSSGYEGTSIREVARRAGISHGTIYLHFRDKDDMLFQVSEAAFGRLLTTLRTRPRSQDPIERLMDAFRAFGAYGLDHPHQYKLMMGQRPTTFDIADSARFGPMAEQVSGFMNDLMQEARKRSFVSDGSGRLDHLALLAAVHGTLDMFYLHLIDRQIAERAIDHAVALLLSALTGGTCAIEFHPASGNERENDNE